jgi:ATP-binding cassette subfamily B protein
MFSLNVSLWTAFYLLLLLPGLFLRYFFDSLSDTASISWGTTLPIILLASAIISRIPVLLGARDVDITHRLTIETLLGRNILERIFETSAENNTFSPSEVVSRFRDDIDRVKWYLLSCVEISARIVFLLTALTIMFQIQPMVTVVSFLPIILVSAVSRLISERIKKYRTANREANEAVVDYIGEIFGAIQAVQVATKQNSVFNYFKKLNEKRRKVALMDFLFTELQEAGFAHLVNLSTGMILLLVASLMKENRFSIGDLILFIFYLTYVTNFAYDWGVFLTRTKQVSVSFNRLIELLKGGSSSLLVEHKPVYLKKDLPELSPSHISENAKLHTLVLENISYLHPHSSNGIKNISLTIKGGSFVAITGQIGSGKTTLLRVLLGLLEKQQGHIYWNDKKVENPAQFFIPPHCAYTPQIPRLFSGTLRENILMGLPEESVGISEAIDVSMLSDDINRREKGLDTIIGSKGVKLSGGQIQRTAAARMFVRKSQLFFLDDLSSALDVKTERQLWEKVFKMRGTTCVIVSHRRAVLERADHIIVLKEGRIAGEGKLHDLLETCEEMQRLL